MRLEGCENIYDGTVLEGDGVNGRVLAIDAMDAPKSSQLGQYVLLVVYDTRCSTLNRIRCTGTDLP